MNRDELCFIATKSKFVTTKKRRKRGNFRRCDEVEFVMTKLDFVVTKKRRRLVKFENAHDWSGVSLVYSFLAF